MPDAGKHGGGKPDPRWLHLYFFSHVLSLLPTISPPSPTPPPLSSLTDFLCTDTLGHDRSSLRKALHSKGIFQALKSKCPLGRGASGAPPLPQPHLPPQPPQRTGHRGLALFSTAQSHSLTPALLSQIKGEQKQVTEQSSISVRADTQANNGTHAPPLQVSLPYILSNNGEIL